MKKTKFFVAVTLALVMCCSLSIPFASAAEMNAEDGWEYISAPLISEGEDGLEPQVHFGTNGNGVLHYNNLLRSAYAETISYPWVTTTWMYAKVTIGTRSQDKSYNGAKESIKTNSLYAGPGEYTAKTTHSLTINENWRQNYNHSHYFN